MRVAVHLPEGHPHAPDGPTVVAFRLGRVREGVDNLLVHTGETIELREFVGALVEQAKAEYPDAKVVVERLVVKGEDEAEWIPAEEFNPEVHTAAPGGSSRAQTFSAETRQETN